ncbi:MAG: ATP-binding protein [Leadbetterella sp.]
MVENNEIESNSPSEADIILENARFLRDEILWFASCANAKLADYISKSSTENEKEKGFFSKVFGSNSSNLEVVELDPQIKPIEPPRVADYKSIYADFIKHYSMSVDERLVLILTIIPHIQPQLLDSFFAINPLSKRAYTEFGGIKKQDQGGFLPTIQTAIFVLSGNNLAKQLKIADIFEPDHYFFQHNILYIQQSDTKEPSTNAQICITDEYLDLFTRGKHRKPQFNMSFPAKRLHTKMEWEDLVLNENTMKALDEIRIWLQHGQKVAIDWGLGNKLKPGYKALFYGASGTGKTLTAALLGKTFGIDVYRIDLSMVISKYIGETEQNLEKVFKRAENKNWILFFDEVDAILGKRTNVSDSHDKYANQEVSYLLQRLEEYNGLVILSTNMRFNIDDAFNRRINSFVQFSPPTPAERLILWKKTLGTKIALKQDVNLEALAHNHDLTGASIVNVVQYASLMAISRNENQVSYQDLDIGIRKEYLKEGKTI